jgi:hypothetical protein
MGVQQPITKSDIGQVGATGICAGAQVRTPVGGKRIEFLRKGDLVVTRDNGLQPVRMVFARKVTEAQIAADPSLAPVILRPRAIAPMMPQRDLAVGGSHRLLIPGWRLLDEEDGEACLVPARDIAGLDDRAFVERNCGEVTFYNVVFDGAEVFTANGLPVESFRPTVEMIGQVDRAVRDDILAQLDAVGSKPADFPAPRYKLRERVSYSPNFA